MYKGCMSLTDILNFSSLQVQMMRTSKQSVIEEVITRVEETEKEVIEEKTIRTFQNTEL